MMYLFELGRNTDLSRAEIEQVFLSEKIPFQILGQEKQFLFVKTTQSLSVPDFMRHLGGTIKIAEQIAEKCTLENISEYIQNTQFEGKIQFSFSGNNAKTLALETKRQLKSLGRSVRYIEANNTATILHNNLVEKQGDFTLTNNGIFVTRAIQDIEEWGDRDFGRPGRDSRSGMLPPKLARILINLTGVKKDSVLFDPFCGSGTIVTEALSLGFTHIIGTDISEKAIEDTKKNLEWSKEKNPFLQTSKTKIFVSPVEQISSSVPRESVDAICCEPYMGKPLRGNEDRGALHIQTKELSLLYINAFKEFHKVLKPGGIAIFIIPKFLHKKEWITIDCLEDIQKIGFSQLPLAGSLSSALYHRPDQFVAREIWKFQKIG